jgi:hypothetical protein
MSCQPENPNDPDESSSRITSTGGASGHNGSSPESTSVPVELVLVVDVLVVDVLVVLDVVLDVVLAMVVLRVLLDVDVVDDVDVVLVVVMSEHTDRSTTCCTPEAVDNSSVVLKLRVRFSTPLVSQSS